MIEKFSHESSLEFPQRPILPGTGNKCDVGSQDRSFFQEVAIREPWSQV